jgi:DNA mismatch endonuclease (patch repair protein)
VTVASSVDPSRSAVMRAVRSSGTGPEQAVRRALRSQGVFYRLGGWDLPGRPDLVMPGRRLAMFVHGCFWHGHACPRGAREPKTNIAYWRAKIARNRARDALTLEALAARGWRPVVVWECETRKPEMLAARLRAALASP